MIETIELPSPPKRNQRFLSGFAGDPGPQHADVAGLRLCALPSHGVTIVMGSDIGGADQRIEQFLCVTVTTPISWSSFHLWETTRT